MFLSVCPAGCLYYICKALEKDIGYSKGRVLKEKIFEEQPCLRRDSMKMFSKLYAPFANYVVLLKNKLV